MNLQVNLGDEVDAHLGFFRDQANSLMTETVDFFTETYEPPESGTGGPVVVETIVHEAVPAAVKFHTVQVTDREQAGRLLAVQQTTLRVPVGAAPDARPDMFVRVTGSKYDPSFVGRKFRVSGMPKAGTVTVHRFPLEEVN